MRIRSTDRHKETELLGTGYGGTDWPFGSYLGTEYPLMEWFVLTAHSSPEVGRRRAIDPLAEPANIELLVLQVISTIGGVEPARSPCHYPRRTRDGYTITA